MPPKLVTRKFVRELLGRTKRAPKAKIGKYAADDIELLLTYVAELRKDRLREFLEANGLPKGGSKAEVVRRLKESIDDGVIGYDDLISLLDEVEPWGKQHVFLLSPTTADPGPWKDKKYVSAVVAKHGLRNVFNRTRTLLLPDELKLSSFSWSPSAVRVTAVERRVGYERISQLDSEGEDADGDPIEYRAYVQRTTRGLIAFEWDLVANHAAVQITQLPMHSKYEEAHKRFNELVEEWLPVDDFAVVDLQAAIVEFHRMEREGEGGVRLHRVELQTPDGRRIAGTSASAQQPLLGNDDIDAALENIADNGGTGHLGNFYLIPDAGDPSNPIRPGDDVHIMILGNRNRLNVMTPQREEVVRYAIRRVREAC